MSLMELSIGLLSVGAIYKFVYKKAIYSSSSQINRNNTKIGSLTGHGNIVVNQVTINR